MNLAELRALVGQYPAIVKASNRKEIVKYIIEKDMADICQVLLEWDGFFSADRRAKYLRHAAYHDSVGCFKVFLKAGAKADDNMLHQSIWRGARAVPKLLMESGFRVRHSLDVWPKLYQRCLAVRQLARRATERALRHAGVCKDVALMIGHMVATQSEVSTHWEQVLPSPARKKN